MNLANKLTIFRIILVPIMVIVPFLGINGEIIGIPITYLIIDLIFISMIRIVNSCSFDYLNTIIIFFYTTCYNISLTTFRDNINIISIEPVLF